MRVRGVRPGVGDGTEGRALLGDFGKDVQQSARGTGQTVEACHDKHVAGFQLADAFAQFAALCLGPAGVSEKMIVQPAARMCSIWLSRDGPSVDTRA